MTLKNKTFFKKFLEEYTNSTKFDKTICKKCVHHFDSVNLYGEIVDDLDICLHMIDQKPTTAKKCFYFAEQSMIRYPDLMGNLDFEKAFGPLLPTDFE
jgi:ribosomal protein L40E